ncbi:HlyD family secretion protein [Thermodesulfatator atlanticus]|uniref:HlyD family secretion protein n=1 Tax=Thermodesulfatator atlanticus TaxID=501497 RepID=UPI0003B60B80|nr:HlyD family secretion protein [Thermodesulfatator atlanticus]
MSRSNKSKRQQIGLLVLIVLLVGLVVWLFLFIHHRMRYAVTNAVFVETDELSYVSFSQVAGKIIKVTKDEGEKVKKGETLAKLDDAPYRKALERLEAERKALFQKKEALSIDIARVSKDIELRKKQTKQKIAQLLAEKEALKSKRAALLAQISQLEKDQKRYQSLVARNLAPERQLEEIETKLKELLKQKEAISHNLKALEHGIRAAQENLALLDNQKKVIAEKEKELKALLAKVDAISAAVASAKLNLDYTSLRAPIAGVVAKRFHVPGDVVGPGEPVYAIVDPAKIYILVLLEETKLHGVEVGCPAKIKIDAYPDKDFEGEVTEILPATAAKFALVPRDVSAGEFTKVAQRVPVKIRITKGPIELLRVGLGGSVEIKRK